MTYISTSGLIEKELVVCKGQKWQTREDIYLGDNHHGGEIKIHYVKKNEYFISIGFYRLDGDRRRLICFSKNEFFNYFSLV